MLTFQEAYQQVLEPATGKDALWWSMKAQDRLWLLAGVDDWSTGKWGDYRGCTFYLGRSEDAVGHYTGYELMDGILVFTSRREAEAYRLRCKGADQLYAVNMGDLARYDLWRCGQAADFTPRFKATEPFIEHKERVLRVARLLRCERE